MKSKQLIVFFLIITNHLFAQTRIAFGSCARPEKGLSILDTCLSFHPNYFIFLGDNVYADTEDEDSLVIAYNLLIEDSSFQRLNTVTSVLATWDDHDYGRNDAGRHLKSKGLSKRVFSNAFQIPTSSKIFSHEGIYNDYYIEENGKRIQLICIDTRSFRDNLMANYEKRDVDSLGYAIEYFINENKDSTLLGKVQWEWLDHILSQSADYRILCSSIQFAHSYNGFESWNNFPEEKKKLYSLLRKHAIKNLSIISGDVHIGEFSIARDFSDFELIDFTSSGLTSKWHSAIPNKNRIGKPVFENHFGLMEFDWNARILKTQIITIDGTIELECEIKL
jgi:alkaline phosphatase D